MSVHRFTRESAALARKDPVVARLRKQYGPVEVPVIKQSAFSAVARSVVFQQLAGAAASTIWRRFVAANGGRVSADSVRALAEAEARSAGLSNAKWHAVQGLGAAVDSGALKMRGLSRLDEAAIRERLTQVKGVGPWTANMFLIFHLQRLDVWPVGDLGVRRGFGRAWGHAQDPSAKALQPLADHMRPYRSLVAWYCWRAADAPA